MAQPEQKPCALLFVHCVRELRGSTLLLNTHQSVKWESLSQGKEFLLAVAPQMVASPGTGDGGVDEYSVARKGLPLRGWRNRNRSLAHFYLSIACANFEAGLW